MQLERGGLVAALERVDAVILRLPGHPLSATISPALQKNATQMPAMLWRLTAAAHSACAHVSLHDENE